MSAPELAADPHGWCRAVCLDLPEARTDQPFDADSRAFRVHGRIFALLMDVPHVSPHPLVNLKAAPLEVPLLVATHAWVLPGYHMNKRHWISVELGPATDAALAASLVEDSFDHVTAALPRRLRGSLG
ncbi:MAG: MmcQ/YjbR family DNA-binding protein [Cellulomonadaceae bacterium]